MRTRVWYACAGLLATCYVFYMIFINFSGYKNAYQIPSEEASPRGPSNASHRYNGGTNGLSRAQVLETVIFTNGSTVPLYKVGITARDFRQSNILTGNPLIDDYGNNDMGHAGENGRGVTFTGRERKMVKSYMKDILVNVLASDNIPFNRIVPDSRPEGCADIKYPHDLPTVSIVVPFYNEWPSIVLRTVYSIINRSPRHLLKEIVLIDDASDMESVKEPLDRYINSSFPRGLVKLIHLPERVGLIRGRLIGRKHTTGDVIIFFDSHMEVNIDWLQPLLLEIKKDPHTVAMGTLDYIAAETFQYNFYEDHTTRYGFDWTLTFFETSWRNSQVNGTPNTASRVGAVMVGAAYAIDAKYFEEIGTYDEGMGVWGGENLEMSWRVWLCGGRLVHLPCSHIGHIARSQPYSFPGGREAVQTRNYKRAVDVWMGDYKKYVYDHFPDMENTDAGDLTERIQLKERLQCKKFTWFIDNVWPELNVFEKDSLAWGSIENPSSGHCLDTDNFVFPYRQVLLAKPCTHKLNEQGFNWDKGHRLRSSLHCVVFELSGGVQLDDCLQGKQDFWVHEKDGEIRHNETGKCLHLDAAHAPVLQQCNPDAKEQKWHFRFYNI